MSHMSLRSCRSRQIMARFVMFTPVAAQSNVETVRPALALFQHKLKIRTGNRNNPTAMNSRGVKCFKIKGSEIMAQNWA